MECNIGAQDKKIRIGVGIVLLLLGLFKSWILLVFIGLVALVTGLLNFCPAYKLIGMNTNTGTDTGGAADSVKEVASDAKEAAGDAADKVKDVAGDAKEAVADAADDVVDKVADVAGDAKDAVTDAAEDVVDAAKDAVKKD